MSTTKTYPGTGARRASAKHDPSRSAAPVPPPSDTLFAHARNTDPSTSHDAASRATANLPSTQAKVYACLVPGPCTDAELVERMADYFRDAPVTPQRVRTSRADLVKAGLVRYSGRDGKSEHGNRAQIWEIAS